MIFDVEQEDCYSPSIVEKWLGKIKLHNRQKYIIKATAFFGWQKGKISISTTY